MFHAPLTTCFNVFILCKQQYHEMSEQLNFNSAILKMLEPIVVSQSELILT